MGELAIDVLREAHIAERILCFPRVPGLNGKVDTHFAPQLSLRIFVALKSPADHASPHVSPPSDQEAHLSQGDSRHGRDNDLSNAWIVGPDDVDACDDGEAGEQERSDVERNRKRDEQDGPRWASTPETPQHRPE